MELRLMRTPNKKEIILTAVRPNEGLQAIYRRKLFQIIEQMHASVLYWVTARYKANEPKMALDALPATALRDLMRKLSRQWQMNFMEAAPALADYFAKAVNKRSDYQLEQILKRGGFSVAFRMTRPMQDVMAATIGEQVGLIKSIAQKYLTDVEGLVMRSVSEGRDLKTLTDALGPIVNLKRIGMGRKPGESDKSLLARTKRRAALIARDQNNKATATMTRVRQDQLDITEAIWQHSHGGKEPRPTHVANSGKRYKIAKGWYDPAIGKYIWPGTEINCRCVSRSVIPGFIP